MIKKFENFKNKVECKCGWSWEIDPEDDRPYWCHNCGYDNKDGKYYTEDLKKWIEENGKVNEEVNIDVDIEKPFSEYGIMRLFKTVRKVLTEMGYEIQREEEFFGKMKFITKGKTKVIANNNLNKVEIRYFNKKDRGEYVIVPRNVRELTEYLMELEPEVSYDVFKNLNESEGKISWEEFDSDVFKPKFLRSDVISEISKEFGEKVKNVIGEGSNGWAFLLESNKVLKLTFDRNEASTANRLRKLRSYRHIISYYDVRQLEYEENMYAIIMDYVEPLKPFEKHYWGNFSNNFLKKNDITIDYITENIMKSFIREKYDCVNFWSKIYPQIKEIQKETSKLGIALNEAHEENVGFDQYGQLKIFDVNSKYGKIKNLNKSIPYDTVGDLIDPYPFDELPIGENVVIRTFKQDTDSDEFIWHRDREDRIVEVIGNTDWKLQIDNEMPKTIEEAFIPKNIYHRVIKGTGDLKVKITKLK